jgi:hypothetical protein
MKEFSGTKHKKWQLFYHCWTLYISFQLYEAFSIYNNTFYAYQPNTFYIKFFVTFRLKHYCGTIALLYSTLAHIRKM